MLDRRSAVAVAVAAAGVLLCWSAECCWSAAGVRSAVAVAAAGVLRRSAVAAAVLRRSAVAVIAHCSAAQQD